MIGKLVAGRHADAVRRPIPADDIDAGDLGFLSAILGVPWDQQASPIVRKMAPLPL